MRSSVLYLGIVAEMTGQTGFVPAQLAVTAGTAVESDGLWRVWVTASYPFETLIPWPGIPHQVTLQRTVVLRGIR